MILDRRQLKVRPHRWAAIAIAVVWVAIVLAHPALAQSAGALRAAARQIAGEIAAQKRAGKFDVAAQQRAIERLGKLTLAFIALSDRTSYAGRRGDVALASAYDAISAPLDEIYDRNNSALERMAKQIMDEDGDLEALYETQPFKDAQLVATQALYFCNWLHYYGARLKTGAQRKALLEKAQRGFSEFAVGDRHSELLVESLLGRGLCHLELGNAEYAVHDLKAVANDPKASAERRSKARLALLDAYVRAGNVREALQLSQQLLGSGSRTEDNWVRFLRIRALLDGAKSAKGAEAARYRRDALQLMDRLRRAGPGWQEKVAALAQTGIENPEQWADNASNPFARWEVAKMLVQKGDYKQATPLLEAFVASTDPAMQKYHGEAQYFLGLAKFQAGEYQAAADQLDAALQDEKASYGADAAYMRFKAAEAVAAKNAPDAEVSAQYERAIRDFLSRYPEHRSAFEAQFRLGELLQAQHQFADALAAYAKVQGDPAFELRAQFATLQCRFELLQAANHRAPEQQRAALLTEIGTGLQAFDKGVAAYTKNKPSNDQVPLDQMQAKVAIMQAVYFTLQPEPRDAAVITALAGFEEKYPNQEDLLPQVVRLRLTAYQRLGRFADAQAEVQRHGELLLANLGPSGIEDLAVSFIREGARRNSQGDAAANQAAQQVALRLYEQLADENGSDKVKLTLARLYENSGDPQKANTLYAEVLQGNATSLSAMRGLARIAEVQHKLPEAMGYWQRLGKLVRPGDLPWYEASYQVARLTDATGNKRASCEQLTQLKPAMPGLSDADLRKKLDELYKQVCG